MPAVLGTDHSLVGTAVGYLFSAHLRPDALDRTAASEGAVRLERPLRRAGISASAIERRAVECIAKLKPSQKPLDGEQWLALCRMVVILARFEQYLRAGPTVLSHLAEPLSTHREDLDELALALTNEPSMRDLDALGRITIEDHLSIRDARELAIGPTFAQSAALGGADADLIYDGTLLDLKSSSQARIVGRDEVWQLVGYLLADTDNRYKISHLGFAALRRRRSISWPAEDLISQLTAGQPHTVEQVRQEFASLIAARERLARPTVRSKVP